MERKLKFNKVKVEIIDKLKVICGSNNVFCDKESLENYAYDEGSKSFITHPPEVVVKPDSVQKVSKIMKLANEELLPVTPRGAGSGLTGAAIPIYGGIVLSLEKMNKILEIDKINRVAVVEPGVVTNDLCNKVIEEDLYYAGYPMSVETSFIGGNVATNAGGSQVIKYGNTRKHILGLEVVLPTGEILNLGGKIRKSTWGYDLLDLMIGSEGTLGIFTKIIVNLLPAPGKAVDLLIPFKSIEEAVDAVANVLIIAKVLPTAVELIDKPYVDLATKYQNISLPQQSNAEAYLITRIEANSREELEQSYERIGEAYMENGALDVFIADNRTLSDKIWKLRRDSLDPQKAVDPYVTTSGDIVVPLSVVPEMIRLIKEIAKKYNVKTIIVAHIGDGNIHVDFLKPSNILPNEWLVFSEKIYEEITIEAIKMGGVGSGEHGVGLLKRDTFLNSKTETEIMLMRGIKKLFDPNWILNPGKII
jgi:glycolate oxidase